MCCTCGRSLVGDATEILRTPQKENLIDNQQAALSHFMYLSLWLLTLFPPALFHLCVAISRPSLGNHTLRRECHVLLQQTGPNLQSSSLLAKLQVLKGSRTRLLEKLYVEWGSTNTTDTSVFMMKISHILKCEGK